METHCRKPDCGVLLVTGSNWYASNAAKGIRLCSECSKRKNRDWSHDNPAQAKAHYDRYAKANPEKRIEKDRAYAANNPEKRRAKDRRWRQNNPARINYLHGAYRARKFKQTPPDADLTKIAEFYDLAHRLQALTGEPWQVDHIVPLTKGGLHHQTNLQVVPKYINVRKHAVRIEYWYSNDYLTAVLDNRSPYTS